MRTARYLLATFLVLLALALYGHGARIDRAFDGSDRRAFLDRHAVNPRDTAKTRALAEAYWTRNRDVADDAIFGRAGSMGVFGAREHYTRHGKREGRRWGL